MKTIRAASIRVIIARISCLILLFLGSKCYGQYIELNSTELLEKKTELKAQGSTADYPALYKRYHAYLSEVTPDAFPNDKIIELQDIIAKHPLVEAVQIDAANTKVILTAKGNVSFDEVKSVIWDLGMVVHHHETKYAIKSTH